MNAPRSQPGFTLIELLVVVSIIALLVGLLLPVLGKARQAGQAAQCLSNQKQTGTALINYTTEHDGQLMHYRQQLADGALWWFGFEQGGPTGGSNRPLDKTRGPLADYLGQYIDQGLACPAFPSDDPGFVPKFAVRSAHFGYNGGLCWPFPAGAPPQSLDAVDQPSEVFSFVDAVHQDFNITRFYEPHTVAYRKPGYVEGAGHYRHHQRANSVFLDGHAEPLEPPASESTWARFGNAEVVNVDTADGPGTRYGFNTWTH